MQLPRFSLAYMGAELVRTSAMGPDPRVDFVPDFWQSKLLDIVDRNASALVVAPTSCGKTFISFYAAERVLRSSDNQVCVIVVPTVALVNQLVADVGARYEKKVSAVQGYTMIGHFTRDDRHKPDECQVLITVPQCLEIMLMSLHEAEWAGRVAYVSEYMMLHCCAGCASFVRMRVVPLAV